MSAARRPHRPARAVLRPVRRHHAFESCVEQLGDGDPAGRLSAGSTLPSERDLAERLGVSRATLREAIAALRRRGLVETRRGRGGGTVVSSSRARRPGAGRPSHARKCGAGPGSTSCVFRRIVEPGAACLAAAAPQTGCLAGACCASLLEQRTSRWPGRPRLARTGRPTPGFHLTVAAAQWLPPAGIEAVTGVQADAARDAACDPRARRRTSPTPTGSTPPSYAAVLAGRPDQARAGDGASTVTTPPRCCADCSADRGRP